MPLLNLNQKLENKQDLPKKKRLKRWIIGVLVFLLILGADIYFPTRNMYAAAKIVSAETKVLQPAVKSGNFNQIQSSVKIISQQVGNIKTDLKYLAWLRLVPFVNKYYTDAYHFASARDDELQAANIVIKNLEPYKDELGLNGQPVAGQDKIAQGVKVLDKIIPHINEIEPFLKKARLEMDQVDVSSYPEKYGNRKLRSNLQFAKDFIIGMDIALENDLPLIRQVPSALGEDSPKTYLMLFQNDKELRATGGFITAYAFLKIDKGHLSTTESSDIYKLDQKLLDACRFKICPLTPPKAISLYLPELDGKPRTAWSLRDSNFSPDLPTSAAEFEKMYSYLNNSDRVKFDGIITIDTNVVENLISLTGPITIDGTQYSANQDPRCNCANVIYELEHYAEVASKGEPGRKEVVGTLMQQILSKILGVNPANFPNLMTTMISLANHKDVMFYVNDKNLQSGLSKIGWTGEVAKDPQTDYLNINDSNFAGGKSNLYVEATVTDNITIAGSGTVDHDLTIKYENPQPFNTWLNGILRDYIRIYTPSGSKLNYSRGSESTVGSNDDKSLNKTFFDAFIEVRPQNYQIISFKYTSAVKATGHTYHLLIQKQPGAKDNHYIININGQKKADFNLAQDQNLNLNF